MTPVPAHPAAPAPAALRTVGGAAWDDERAVDLSFPDLQEILAEAVREQRAVETLPPLDHLLPAGSDFEVLASWREAFARHRARGDARAKSRAAVLWRTTRWLASARTAMPPESMLQDLVNQQGGAEALLEAPAHRPHPPNYRRGALTTALTILDSAPLIPVLPTLPPRDHEGLLRVQAAHALAAVILNAHQSHQGQAGALGLLDPDTTPQRFADLAPPLSALLLYERELIAETGRILGTKTIAAARELLREREGLAPAETNHVLAAARRWCQHAVAATLEDRQAMLTMRLEDVADRARAALDIRTEVSAMRLLIKVQGLSEKAGTAQGDRALLRLMEEQPVPVPPSISTGES